MPDKALIEEITRKIEARQPVTREEEKIYMMEVFAMSEREVLRVFAINDLNGKTINGVTMLVD